MEKSLLEVINEVRRNKRQSLFTELSRTMRLREDLGFESLDLAELTVRIEDKFGVDVFEDGLIATTGEIMDKISAEKRG